MSGKLSLEFLKACFMGARADHPGRRGGVDNPRGRGHGRMVSGNSKYHRKLVRMGVK